jgi:BASS family bile acid:Na+ symporter
MSPAALLALAGRHGPLLLLAGVLAGLAWPGLAAACRPAMDVAVFGFTLGAFLKVEPPALRGETGRARLPRNLAVLAWSTFGVPLAGWGLILLLRPAPELAEGMLLCLLAPPVGGAAALACMLGLNAPVALLASVAATALSPLVLPALAELLGGYALALEPLAMARRLGLIVGGTVAASWLLRRWAGRSIAAHPEAVTGAAVVALVVFALGAMQGMQARFAAEPGLVAAYLGIAFAVNGGFQLLGAALFARAGLDCAATVGLISGNRSVGFAWAAVGATMPPLVETYFAMAVLPIYVLPVVAKPLVALARRRGWLRGWRPAAAAPALVPFEAPATQG